MKVIKKALIAACLFLASTVALAAPPSGSILGINRPKDFQNHYFAGPVWLDKYISLKALASPPVSCDATHPGMYFDTDQHFWVCDGSSWAQLTGAAAVGMAGPGSSTDNALPRFDGTGGSTLQASGVIVSDANLLTAAAVTTTGNIIDGGTLAVAGNVAVNTDKFTVTAASGNTAIAGTLAVTGNTALTGDLALATSKFTVAAASGNTVVAGTLGVTGNVAVNTNKFNVTAASGNTTVAGTLGVTGVTTLTGGVVLASASVPTNANDACTAGSVAYNTSYVFICVATNTWLRAAIATW